MAGRRSFAELRARMSPGAQAKAESEAKRLGEEMDLAEVRRALKLSQELDRANASDRTGLCRGDREARRYYVSTLRRFIEAMGGELEIVARFADHTIKFKNFSDLNEIEKERA